MGIAQGIASYIKNNKFNTLIGVTTLPGALDEYEENRANGHGAVVSALGAGFNFAMPMVMNMKQLTAYGLISHVGDIADGVQQINSYQRQLGAQKYANAFSNAQFNDTEQVHTMRQAGMAMLQRGKYNMQSALMGNEAKYMYK